MCISRRSRVGSPPQPNLLCNPHNDLNVRCALLVLALASVPLASAGTAEDPEIRDDTGDVDVSVHPSPVGFPVDAGPPREALDIVASWFHDETESSISLTMAVADLSGTDEWDDPTFGFIRWGTRFELTNYNATSDDYWENTWIMGVDLNNGPTGWRASLSPPNRDGELQPDLAATYDIDQTEGTLTVTVDRADLGHPMAGDAMTETLSLHDGSWGAASRGIDYKDQAPGTYPSRDFVFQLDTGQSGATEPSETLPTPSITSQDNTTGNESSKPPAQETPMSPLTVLLAIAFAVHRSASKRT